MRSKLFILLFFMLAGIDSYACKNQIPKNTENAVQILMDETTDSVKNIIKSVPDDSLYLLCYPKGNSFANLHSWLDENGKRTKLKRYFKKKEIENYTYRVSVVLIAFKHTLLYGSFDEDSILKPWQDKQAYLNEQHRNRFSADTLYGVYIPYNLEDCFRQLDYMFADSIRAEFIILDEKTFASRTHFGLGKWIRNNWQLWGGSRLSTYFQGLGVYHPDDISWIILTAYHRHIAGKEINVEELIESTEHE